MARRIAALWQWIREHAGIFSVGCALLISFLGALIRLLPPPARLIWIWILIFSILFLVGFIAMFVQQKFARLQAKKQDETLDAIADAVGAAQAEVADSAAETKRHMLELEVKISDQAKPLVVIRMSVDGDRNPEARPTVENLGKTTATNIRIETIIVNGAKGPGTFVEIDVLQSGERKEVEFSAPEEGLFFGQQLIHYLENELRSRPPIDWQKVESGERDLFEPLRMPLYVTYVDPITNRRYRSEHDLEFTFSRHVTVIFRAQTEIT